MICSRRCICLSVAQFSFFSSEDSLATSALPSPSVYKPHDAVLSFDNLSFLLLLSCMFWKDGFMAILKVDHLLRNIDPKQYTL